MAVVVKGVWICVEVVRDGVWFAQWLSLGGVWLWWRIVARRGTG